VNPADGPRDSTPLDVPALLAAYDAQLRARIPDPLPARLKVARDGPLVRFEMPKGGFVGYRDLGGLEGAELDALIERQVRFFAERGKRFEWKHHGHDLPTDLPERLRAAGFVPEELETVEIARVEDVAAVPVLPEGVSLREVTARGDFDRIAAFETEIWQDDHIDLVEMFESERAADPTSITILVVETAGGVVCAAWMRFERGTDFATLWGGATLPAWRGRGIYRATVAHRASLAAERGFRFLEVDSSPDSRPILERLGFEPVTTTTPYIWSPAPANPGA
jgi:GNAT superfamily N-acetyltransferase